MAGFSLKLLIVVSFQHVGQVGFSLIWFRAHSEQKQCPHVRTTGAS